MINQQNGDKYYCDRCNARILMRESYRIITYKHFFFPRPADITGETILCDKCKRKLDRFLEALPEKDKTDKDN